MYEIRESTSALLILCSELTIEECALKVLFLKWCRWLATIRIFHEVTTSNVHLWIHRQELPYHGSLNQNFRAWNCNRESHDKNHPVFLVATKRCAEIIFSAHVKQVDGISHLNINLALLARAKKNKLQEVPRMLTQFRSSQQYFLSRTTCCCCWGLWGLLGDSSRLLSSLVRPGREDDLMGS